MYLYEICFHMPLCVNNKQIIQLISKSSLPSSIQEHHEIPKIPTNQLSWGSLTCIYILRHPPPPLGNDTNSYRYFVLIVHIYGTTVCYYEWRNWCFYKVFFNILQIRFRNLLKAVEKTIEFLMMFYKQTSQLQPFSHHSMPHPQTSIWCFSWTKSIYAASQSYFSGVPFKIHEIRLVED